MTFTLGDLILAASSGLLVGTIAGLVSMGRAWKRSVDEELAKEPKP